ncbi:MAG: DUF3817 domain-containing protein [Brevibacterium yomogidense]|uniref:Cytochrome c-type biogenesis protein DsbD, protein-disulfide reductase n=1 Tax=Brevibacterium yomogidense TaxID=946573 RepID=A0A1X6XR39_9MICO|nr:MULTISPECIES: DUF3817 domain-containing protein [Brevibacterium]SLN01017.1 Cytochrome c-type biogenesis protein DsbD, protein-disulfide reductase [Brevibacterium yomogidense]SMX77872.1 integral membrane protein [Brevibacterium sp. Mu109]
MQMPRAVRDDDRDDDGMTPKRLFTIVAIGEAITWTLLLLGMFLKYVTRSTEVMVSIGGGVHGFMFLAYCVATVFVGVSQQWGIRAILLGLGSAIIPYATIPFEIGARRRGLLDGAWGLAAGGREPKTLLERPIAWGIRKPVSALLTGVLAVAVVFTVLLILGPPV